MTTAEEVGRMIVEVVLEADLSGWPPDEAERTQQVLLEHAAALGHVWSGMPTLHFHGVPDQRPHSRACGWRVHPHGSGCSTNCPTCHGELMPDEVQR